MNTNEVTRFYALPSCPHLTASPCGYSLLALEGLDVEITSSQIERITIDGTEQKIRPIGDKAVMIIPEFRLEAQTVKIYKHGVPVTEKPFKTILKGVVPPDHSYGLTAPHSRHGRTSHDAQ